MTAGSIRSIGKPGRTEPNMTTKPYQVKLEIFEGPLDLLLYLIRQEELDIYELPIARITQQYLEYLELRKALDLEIAG